MIEDMIEDIDKFKDLSRFRAIILQEVKARRDEVISDRDIMERIEKNSSDSFFYHEGKIVAYENIINYLERSINQWVIRN